MSGTTVDGVHRLPPNGINVVVIGAGNAGLQTALESWRKGCDVVVLEKAEKISPLGDFFTITPSALCTLKEYPSMFKDYHRTIYNCSVHCLTPSGKEAIRAMPEWKRPGVVTAAPDVDVSFIKRRTDFAQMQVDQLERLGVQIFWGDRAASIVENADGVVVTTESGKEYKGDVCVGASGIGSMIPGFNAGPAIEVQDSGYAVARCAFSRSVIKDGSPASALLATIDQKPEFRTYVGKDLHLILFLTPDYVGIAFTHPDYDNAVESWSNLKQPSELISHLEGSGDNWDPAVLDFVRSCPTGVVDWKLRWRDGIEQWTSEGGRMLRLGDAAHAFFPTAGNGAVQGLEDALSIAECLLIGGKDNVQYATKVHNKLRFQRTNILQQTGVLNREELHFADLEAYEHGDKGMDPGFFRMGRWVWSHNPEKYARDNYAACLASIIEGAEFSNTNLPPGHVYQPWTLESEMKRMAAGIKSTLKQNGDWSA